MRYIAGFFLITAFILASCESAEEKAARERADSLRNDSIVKVEAHAKYIHAIDSMEKIMANSKTADPRIASAGLRAYNDFINTFPDDTLTPEYLYRAANLALGQQNYQQAVVFLETIVEKHRNYRRYKEAVFLAAFVYDEYLENVNHGADRARQLYQFVITTYPNDSYAEQAKVLITYVGKPKEEMFNDIIDKK